MKKNIILCLSLCILIIPFLVTRLCLFNNNFIVGYSPDTIGYFRPVEQILNHKFPLFDIRTPGYPIFLYIISLFSQKILTVVLVQNIISLICFSILIYVTFKNYYKSTIKVAIASSIFLCSSLSLQYDTSIIPDSLYTNILVLFIAFLLISFKTNKNIHWTLLSSIMMIAIYVRPAGYFLFSILVIIVAFMIIKKYNNKKIFSLIIPVIIFSITLSTYNYITLNKFTMTPFGSINLLGTTITYLKADNSFPANLNIAINRIDSSISDKDKIKISNSSNIRELFNLYKTNYVKVLTAYNILIDAEKNTNKNNNSLYIKIQDDINKICKKAIIWNCDKYVKFVSVMFVVNYVNVNHKSQLNDFYNERYNLYNSLYGFRNNDEYCKYLLLMNNGNVTENLLQLVLKEYYVNNNSLIKDYKLNEKSNSYKLLRYVQFIQNFFFRNYLWVLIFFTTFLLSIIKYFKSHFEDLISFIIIIICLINIFNALLVSLVEVSLIRYSYSTEITYYLSFALLPLIIDFKKMKFLNINYYKSILLKKNK